MAVLTAATLGLMRKQLARGYIGTGLFITYDTATANAIFQGLEDWFETNTLRIGSGKQQVTDVINGFLPGTLSDREITIIEAAFWAHKVDLERAKV